MIGCWCPWQCWQQTWSLQVTVELWEQLQVHGQRNHQNDIGPRPALACDPGRHDVWPWIVDIPLWLLRKNLVGLQRCCKSRTKSKRCSNRFSEMVVPKTDNFREITTNLTMWHEILVFSFTISEIWIFHVFAYSNYSRSSPTFGFAWLPWQTILILFLLLLHSHIWLLSPDIEFRYES